MAEDMDMLLVESLLNQAFDENTKSLLVRILRQSLEPIPTTIYAPSPKTIEIIRPADLISYNSGDIINAVSATALPCVDLGDDYARKTIEITGITAVSDNQIDDLRMYFYNANTSLYGDNVPFIPTYSDHKQKSCGQPCNIDIDHSQVGSGGLSIRSTSEIRRKIVLDAEGKFYFAPTVYTAFTPTSEQKIAFSFYYFVL